MSLDRRQFQDLIERTLPEVDPRWLSQDAVHLLLGTAAVESEFGTYIRQVGGGPALGVFQIEKATFNDLRQRYGHDYILEHEWHDKCEWDLRTSIIFARLKYWSIPKALPPAESVEAMADYWKKWYNTPAGGGTVEQFIEKYHRYVT